MDPTVFLVVRVGAQWHVVRDGEPILTVDTKGEAVVEARAQALGARPSRLVVHAADGEVEDEATYAAVPLPPGG